MLVNDGNYYLLVFVSDGTLTDFNASDNNFMVDNAKSSTSWDGNSGSWQSTDANVHLACSDANSGCATTTYRLDTDANITVSYGFWTTFDANILVLSDGNWALDFNSMDNAGNIGDENIFFVLVDKNSPTVSISSPTDGATVTSSTVTLVYSGSDSGSGIVKYWVSVDSTANASFIDNGAALTYDFSNQSNGSHTYYVRATDSVDQNSSDANVTVTVSVTTPGGGGGYPSCRYYPYNNNTDVCDVNQTCPGEWLSTYDTQRCCSVACVSTEEPVVEKKLFETQKGYSTQLLQSGLPILDETFPGVETLAKRWATEKDVLVTRNLVVFERIANNEVVGYRHKIKISIQNLRSNPLKGIDLTEEIPKPYLENADDIQTDQNYRVIKKDPIVQFSIETILANQTKQFEYQFDSTKKTGYITQNQFQGLKPPLLLIELLPEDACLGVSCQDFDPCTRDYCENGTCQYAPMANNAVCGQNHVCQSGACIEKTVETTPPETILPPSAPTPFNWAVPAIAILFILTAAGFFWWKKTKHWKNSNN